MSFSTLKAIAVFGRIPPESAYPLQAKYAPNARLQGSSCSANHSSWCSSSSTLKQDVEDPPARLIHATAHLQDSAYGRAMKACDPAVVRAIRTGITIIRKMLGHPETFLYHKNF
jgi:hypothetical protein